MICLKDYRAKSHVQLDITQCIVHKRQWGQVQRFCEQNNIVWDMENNNKILLKDDSFLTGNYNVFFLQECNTLTRMGTGTNYAACETALKSYPVVPAEAPLNIKIIKDSVPKLESIEF